MTTVIPTNSATPTTSNDRDPTHPGGTAGGAVGSAHDKSRARPDIQGLRAVAVGLVILFHAGVPGFDGGYVGVDVFFVISGFLITGQLRRLGGTSLGGQLAGFYARRILRLLPVAGVVVVATVLAAKLIVPPLTMPDVASTGRASGLYVINIVLALRNTAYLSDAAPSPFQHYWSLAVEEQFYLVWPLALLAITALCARRQRRIVVVVAAGVVLSLAGTVYLTGKVQPYAFFLLPTRAWEFGIGALLALAPLAVERWRPVAATCLGWAGLTAILAAGVLFDARTPFPGGWALVPALGTAAVIATGSSTNSAGAGRLLSIRPAVWIGGISYSLYLWHWPLLIVPLYGRGGSLGVVTTVALVAAAVGLAIVSERWIERPFRTSAWWREKRRRAYGLGVGITIVTVAVTTSLQGTGALSVGTTLPRWPAGADVAQAPIPSAVGRNLTPSLTAAAADQPRLPARCIADFLVTSVIQCVGGDATSDRTVVLYGDSHAHQWFPALDQSGRDHGFRVVTLLKVACPAVAVPVFNDRLGRIYEECKPWRNSALQAIARLRPTTVVIGQYEGYDLLDGVRGSAANRQWAAAMRNLVDGLPRGTRTLVLGDDPHWAVPPANCLSAHLTRASECSKPPASVFEVGRTAAVESALASAPLTTVLDTGRLLCTASQCPVIGWNVLLYRDQNHVTATAARMLAPAFSTALGEVAG